MTAQTSNLFLRNDTIFGVCEAIGSDFGFNPNWLRVAFCLPMFWSPMLVIGVYCALGLVVAGARLAFPDRTAEIGKAAPAKMIATESAETAEERERELIAA